MACIADLPPEVLELIFITLNLKDLKTKNNEQNKLMEILDIPEDKRNFEIFQQELASLKSAHEELKAENLKMKLQTLQK